MVGSPKATLSTTLAVFRPTPGQRLQRFAVARHLAAVALDQCPAQRDDVLRLGVEQADRLDALAQALFAQRQHLRRRVGLGEQRLGRLVDADVGRLRRQHHRDQQRVGIDERELALRLGIGGGEAAVELVDLRPASAAGSHRRSSARPSSCPASRRALPSAFFPRQITVRSLILIIVADKGRGMIQPAETAVLYSAVLRPHRSAGLSGRAHRHGLGGGVAGGRRRRLRARRRLAGLAVFRPGSRLLYARCGLISAPATLRGDQPDAQGADRPPPRPLGQAVRLLLPALLAAGQPAGDAGQDNRLELRTHGRSLAIASFLLPHERRELALTLRRALGRVSTPPASC